MITVSTPAETSLVGLQVLIVEDEALVAFYVEDLLLEIGCGVAAVAASVAEALSFLATNATKIDVAILDVNVGGEKVFPIADELSRLDVPFVFATGYGAMGLEKRFAKRPILPKPFVIADLETALRSAASRISMGASIDLAD